MVPTLEQRAALAEAATAAGLGFVRLFGSAARGVERPRDYDLAVGGGTLALETREEFRSRAAEIFGSCVDLVELTPGLSPLLVREIAARSLPLWEAPGGRETYALLIDRLLAVAEDEILACPRALADFSRRAAQERLRVS